MTELTGGEVIVKSLINMGVDTIFALPGVQNDWFFNALHGHQDQIRVIHTRHEQATAYMAMGYSMALDKPGVYCVVPGPGFLNTTGALSTAYANGAKVLCLTGEIASGAIGKRRGLLHEIPDQMGIIERLTKWAARVDDPAKAPSLVQEAFNQMINGRPQPVGLEVPQDIWSAKAEFDLPLDIGYPAPEKPAVDLDAIQQAAKLLGEAKKPMIVIGGGATHAAAEVLELAEMLQAPVVPGRNALGTVDARHPLSLVTPAGHGLWGKADVVIGIGARMYAPLQRWGLDDELKIIRVDIDETEHDLVAPPTVKVTADSLDALNALLEFVPKHNRKRASRTDEMVAYKAAFDKRVSVLEPQYSINKALREAVPEDGVFVDEVTQIGFTSRFMYPVYNPRSHLSTGYQGTLGFGYGTALGVAVALPDKPVLNVVGDGGFMYQVQELSTAVRHNINLTTVLFADGAFGNVRRMQKQDYGGKVIASDLHNPDFVKMADAFGVQSMEVNSPEKMKAAIAEGFKHNGPTLIVYPVDEMPSPWPFSFPPPARGN